MLNFTAPITTRCVLTVMLSAKLCFTGALVQAQTADSSADQPRTLDKLVVDDAHLETVLIVAQREVRTSKGATGLEMSLADTPQSVTVLDRDTLDTFGLDDINSVLRLTTGVNVDQPETDRTYYNARGFDITSMQADGIGLPFDGLVVGALDTATFDKVEVVRGANGLLTGIGNPSGTINYVRKRPTNDMQLQSEMTVGSWDRWRMMFDVSSPLTDDGQWAARAVIVSEHKDSYLNLYHNERKVFYGILDGQIGERTTVAVGFTHQDNESRGSLWGALPLIYGNGTQGDFDASTTTAMNWTYWNTDIDTTFAEVGVQLSNDWQLKSTLTYTDYQEPSEIFYVYLDSAGLDASTGLGIYSWPGKFDTKSHSLLSDTSVSGRFGLWGQEHEATLGLSLAKISNTSLDYPALDGFVFMPAFPGWTGNEVARPTFGSPELAAKSEVHLNRLYGATRWSLSDTVQLIAGVNAVDYDSEGYSWGVSTNRDERALSPYLGATWRLTPMLNAYASYSDIYQPQYVLNQQYTALGSAKGKSYEAGLKGEWFNRQLLTTASVFKARQNNLAEFAYYTDGDDIDDTDTSDDFNFALYRGISVESEGYELELSGKLHSSLTLQAGYTHLSLTDQAGGEARTFIPRNTVKLLATWKTPFAPALQLGASARRQSGIYYDSGYGRITQPAYAIFGVNAAYDLGDHLEVSAAVDNLGDEKYLGSLQWDQAFYGAPRSYSAQVSWKY